MEKSCQTRLMYVQEVEGTRQHSDRQHARRSERTWQREESGTEINEDKLHVHQ